MTGFRKRFYDIFVLEYVLNSRLAVVEVPHNAADVYVASLLGKHLLFLYFRNPAFGVKHHYFCAVNVGKALKGGFPRIPGGCHKD